MPGQHYDNMKPERRGPYLMKPGQNSQPSKFENVNFRDSDLKKAEGFPNMYPQNFNAARVAAVKAGKDTFKVGDKEFKVTSKAGAEMYNPEMKPLNYQAGYPSMEIKNPTKHSYKK